MPNEGGFAGHPKKRIRVFWGPRSRPYKNHQRSAASRSRFGVGLAHMRLPYPCIGSPFVRRRECVSKRRHPAIYSKLARWATDRFRWVKGPRRPNQGQSNQASRSRREPDDWSQSQRARLAELSSAILSVAPQLKAGDREQCRWTQDREVDPPR